MSDRKRTIVSELSGYAIVRFTDRKIIGKDAQEVGDEMIAIIEKDNCRNLLLDFDGVEFISSALLNTLIILDKHVRKAEGKLRLTNLRAEILELFVLTRLNQKFDIRINEADARNAFGTC